MDDKLLQLLRTVNTPTVCNAIETAQGKRGFSGYSRVTPVAAVPDGPPIVGYACTGKIASKFPTVESPESERERRLGYFRHVGAARALSVAVVEDIDYPECAGAFWGRTNAAIHKGLGITGVLTNGMVRDLDALPEEFPIIAGSIGPSHGFAHVTGFGMPVTVFGLSIRQGDLIHADRHGAVVIPEDVVDRLADAISSLRGIEKDLLDMTRRPGFDAKMIEDAWSRFEHAQS